MEWYTINNAEEIDSPALIIYPDRVKSNISLLQTFVADVRQLRPHVKTNKCPEVIKLMLEAGIVKFKCATIAEAEILAMEGATDVLFAFQPVGPKAERFCMLQKHFPGTLFSCLIDNKKSLLELSACAGKFKLKIRVLIDLNTGMNRTGIAPGKEALQLYLEANQADGIEITGLHAYDGHLRDTDLQIRKQKCHDAFEQVELLREEIKKVAGKAPLLVAGGTPTFPIYATKRDVESSPGTFIFWDKGYQQILSEQPFQFAALVMARTISKPDDHTICLDLGHKAIASENPISQRVYFLNAPELVPVGHSEEHMVFRTPEKHHYQVGDVLYGVPYHICPTVALYDTARICTGNTIRESWTIAARTRKITI
jgi:D-serine deaminase-like pyridoxal phosphate-dependent protein